MNRRLNELSSVDECCVRVSKTFRAFELMSLMIFEAVKWQVLQTYSLLTQARRFVKQVSPAACLADDVPISTPWHCCMQSRSTNIRRCGWSAWQVSLVVTGCADTYYRFSVRTDGTAARVGSSMQCRAYGHFEYDYDSDDYEHPFPFP